VGGEVHFICNITKYSFMHNTYLWENLQHELCRIECNHLNTVVTIRTTCYNINLLKPSGNFAYHQVLHSKVLNVAHITFMCFVRISEQTATSAL
jgi:hypothetical protein